MDKNKLIVILGPTAGGKTRLAVKLASIFNGEIISADSRQVYKGMDIGTGKDLLDYEIIKKGKKIKMPFHLIDVVSPKTRFSLAKYQKLAYKAIDDINSRGKTPFLVGGTGLYIQAVVDGFILPHAKPAEKLRKSLEKWSIDRLFRKLEKMDSKLAQKIDKGNKRRMIRYIEIMNQTGQTISHLWNEHQGESKFHCLLLGILPKGSVKSVETQNLELSKIRALLNKKIDERVDKRLREGMIEEVAQLHNEGLSWKKLESFGLEYKFIERYLQRKLECNEMVELLKIAIHQFAKRQMTWFKRDKRIKWVSSFREAKKEIRNLL